MVALWAVTMKLRNSRLQSLMVGMGVLGFAGCVDKPGLDIRYANPPVSGGERGGIAQALLEGRHVVPRFQRVLRRDQPPDLVQPKQRECRKADLAMPLMRRIERPAQQADAAGGAVKG